MPERLRRLIRDIQDYPQPGIVFRDITPLLQDRAGLALAAELMVNPFRHAEIDVVVGAESRGFIFGTLLAPLTQCLENRLDYISCSIFD